MLPGDTYFWEGPLPETDQSPTTPLPWGETRVVGKPLPRVDAYDRVSGSAVYPSDVTLPDMLHVALLTCPHAHAIVKRVNTTKAEGMSGVRAILKDGMPGADLAWFADRSGTFTSRLFDPHCRYEGEEVAAVAADTIHQAWDAVRAITVDYDVLDNVVDVDDAMKPGAVPTRDGGNVIPAQAPYERGNVAAGFASADAVVEHVFHTPCQLHSALEPHGCVAKWDGPRLTLWESSQGVYSVQAEIARALSLPLANVRVIGHYVGGAFGSKLSSGKYAAIAALLARKTGRPTRLFLTREQVIRSMGNRPANTITLKAGAKKDGTLVALQSKVVGTGGAYSSGGTGGVDFVIRELYACPNVRCDNQAVYINAGPERPFRGPGHPQGAWALESTLDALANTLGLDPVALRLKNISTISQLRGRPYTSTGLAQCLADGAKAFGWDEARARKPDPASHIVRGVGVAAGMWQGGGGNPPATIIVKLFSDGSAHLNMGAADIGCGTKTWGAQIVAEELNVPIDRISIEHADTATTQFATGSGGSKTAPTESPAIRAAALDVKQQLMQMAADQLQVPAADLEFHGDAVTSTKDPAKTVAVGRIPAFSRRGLIVGVGYRAPNPETKTVNPFAAHFAEVEVNTRTGEVKVLRSLAAHDSGRILNPLTFRNQVIGGMTMGLGFGLTEERVMDRGQLGKVLTAGLHDYKVPTALDVPSDHTVISIDPHDTECNSTGVKGVGEPAMIPAAAALANAVCHATGVRMLDGPISPMRVLNGLAAAAKSQKGTK